MKTIQKIEFMRVRNDINGNPRYVCHFYNLLTKDEEKVINEEVLALKDKYPNNYFSNVSKCYELAIFKAKKIGGKKFHNKQFGGGIVFQSHNIQDTEKSINELNK